MNESFSTTKRGVTHRLRTTGLKANRRATKIQVTKIHVKHRIGYMHPFSSEELYKALWKKLRHGDRTGLAHIHTRSEENKIQL